MKILLAQLNPLVGDIAGNAAQIRKARIEAADQKAELVAFSELFLSGYPAEDLVLKPAFQEACRQEIEALARETLDGGPAMLIGLPWNEAGKLYNAYAYLDEGRILAIRFKVDLPNYGVFDEKRIFASALPQGPVNIRGLRFGLPICEDMWSAEVCECLEESGAEVFIVPNGSPYWRGKQDERIQQAVARVSENRLPLIYLNQICGQDDLIFDGASFGLQKDGALAFQMNSFTSETQMITLEKSTEGWQIAAAPRAILYEGDEADYAATVLALRDYVRKNRFPGVVLGLSGGIDSALAAALAVDALGAEHVHCVMMPYRFTSSESLKDAEDCAKALGVRYDIIPIHQAVESFEAALAPLFQGRPRDITEENLQSRARGTFLMSISNKLGAMVVTTGNKSEMSVGYATLYGDMNGGYNPLKDMYKMQVYRLSALRNRWKPDGALGVSGLVIPQNIIDKAPTAELRENQKDQDSLPPYPALDDILECLVEKEMRVIDIVARGHALETVEKIERLLYLAEYKRRQSAPGAKLTRKLFSRDRRYPITNAFRDRAKTRFISDMNIMPHGTASPLDTGGDY